MIPNFSRNGAASGTFIIICHIKSPCNCGAPGPAAGSC
jgi:hypothetical protein